MDVLEISKLEYKYEDAKRNALTNINVNFSEGKVYGIIGRSGSGKTTLISLIAGLDNNYKGEILYKGENLNKINKDSYRSQNIGIIFQRYNLIQNATAIDNISLSMNISKSVDTKKRTTEILEQMGISSELANKLVIKLSGGEQQRVAIARAIAHNPDIIIADEPTANLDEENEEIVLNLLKDLAHNYNKCVIIVTHSKTVASKVDELYGINKGSLSFIKYNK